ncbi:MAG: flavin reductase family protein, partial [Caulobacteraceae bacterium]|nr:flavin reductase family protein [Caulobacter sp.]
MFSSQGWKDSVANAHATGEFVWNLATRPLAEAMNQSSAALAHGEDEFARAGLEKAECRLVRAPRVAASPAGFECRVVSITELRGLDGEATDHHLVLGQVVGVHIRADALRDGAFDTASARPIARCGGWGDYAEVDSLFQMRRPG